MSSLVCLQVKIAYIDFLNHCYVDTEVEMKEIYTSNHMWKLFENFLVDICRVTTSETASQGFILYFDMWEIFSVRFNPPRESKT